MAEKSCPRALLAQWRLFAFVLIPMACLPLPILWKADSGKAAYILLVSSIFMLLEIVPLSATVLLTIFLIPLTGVQTLQEASKSFVNDSYFLFMGIIILAISIEDVNLHKRMALLTLKAIGVSPSRLIFGFVLISGLLSMWMANTAVTVMILPIAIAVSESLSKLLTKGERGTLMRAKHSQSLTIQMKTNEDLQMELTSGPEEDLDGHLVNKNRTEFENGQNSVDSSQLSKVLQLSVAYGANIGGLATLIGSHPNFIFRMTVERLYGGETGLNFFSYFVVCGPLAVASLFLTWIILSLIYVPKWCRCFGEKSAAQTRQNQMRKAYLDQQHKELGPVRQAEISVVVIFLVVITLWLTRQPQVFSGWGSLLQPGFATDVMPALFAVVILFAWPADFSDFAKGIHRPLMTWKEVQAKLPWDLLLFQGGLTVISNLADESGLILSIGRQIPDLRGMSPWQVVAIICVISSVLTEFTNNSLITAIFLPVLANVAEDSGVNPLYFMLAATLSSMFSFMVPISSFPTIVVYGYGTVSRGDMFKAGIGPKIVCILFLILSLEFLGGFILPDWKEFPEWASERLARRTALGDAHLGNFKSGILNATTKSWTTTSS